MLSLSNTRFILLSALLLLAPLCQAGMQTAIIISNRSKYPVTINFNGADTQCIYGGFNPDDLFKYFNAFATNTNIQFLAPFKELLGINNPKDRLIAAGGSWTIPAWETKAIPQFATIPVQMKSSESCWCKTSVLQWDMEVNGKTWTHSIVDHPTSPWELWQKDPSGAVRAIVLGPGGYFNTAIFDPIVSLFTSKSVKEATAFGGQSPQTPMSYTKFYDGIPVDTRTACIMGRDVMDSYDCLVTGTTLVISSDASTIFAMPMPNVGRKW